MDQQHKVLPPLVLLTHALVPVARRLYPVEQQEHFVKPTAKKIALLVQAMVTLPTQWQLPERQAHALQKRVRAPVALLLWQVERLERFATLIVKKIARPVLLDFI